MSAERSGVLAVAVSGSRHRDGAAGQCSKPESSSRPEPARRAEAGSQPGTGSEPGAGSQPESAVARQIRARALVAGAPPAEIAAAIARECGCTPIRACRLALGIALADVVAQVRARYEAEGRRIPRFSETLLSAYEGGQKRPGPEYLHYLCATYEADPADLGFDGRCLCGVSHRPDPRAGQRQAAGAAVPAQVSAQPGQAAVVAPDPAAAPAPLALPAQRGAEWPQPHPVVAGPAAPAAFTPPSAFTAPSASAVPAASTVAAVSTAPPAGFASPPGSTGPARLAVLPSGGAPLPAGAVLPGDALLPAGAVHPGSTAPPAAPGRPAADAAPGARADEDEDDNALRDMLLRQMSDPASPVDSRFLGAVDRIRRRMDEALLGSSVSATMIERWEQGTAGYGRQYMTVPPLRLLCDVLLDFADVRRSCEERQPLEFSERLCRVAGQLAGLAGIAMLDLGDRRLAHSYFRTARSAADETGDRQLRAWVTVREALVPLYYGDPREAADLANAAGDLAGRHLCVAAVMAPLIEARARARLVALGGGGRRDSLERRWRAAAPRTSCTRAPGPPGCRW
jgi:transcriptional regulator with XRE-family HTH domain